MNFELREYQERTVDGIRKEMSVNKYVLVKSPTGSGKTKISQWIIENILKRDKKCLFTVPRVKLAEQTQKSFGFGNLILGDKSVDNDSLCTIASVQSLYTRKITEHFDFIFIDECHFAHDSEYVRYIFEQYKDSYIIGLSATPIDEKGYLLQGYDSIVSEVTVDELIGLGYLTPVEVFTSINQPDFKDVPISNGDYNQEKAGKIMVQAKVLDNTIEEWQRLGSDLKTIVFTSNIDQCEKMMDKFKAINVTARCVHSKMKQKEIDESYRQFHVNECQILINVDMATFGFDEPGIECMLFARGIKSMRLYKQMVGRGMRTFEGKTKCIMIDCANVIQDNGFPTEELALIKKPIINKTIDKLTSIERETKGDVDKKLTTERVEYLEKIGSLVDLYANKVYKKEQDLVDDCKKIIKRAGFYMWRQNSGKALIQGRWVAFTDKNGLPDITLIYKGVYIGLELKLPKGRLTKAQSVTLPEFIMNGTEFFIIENIVDLFQALDLIQDNIFDIEGATIIKSPIAGRDEKQIAYRKKYNLS